MPALIGGGSSSVALASDIQIGAIEVKNDTDDTRAKVGAGVTTNALRVVNANDDPLVTRSAPPSAGTPTTVVASATDVTILAANTSRKMAHVYNDSTAILYLLLASGTSTTSNYTQQVPPQTGYELPTGQGGVYTGVIKGLWASATGNARVTEQT